MSKLPPLTAVGHRYLEELLPPNAAIVDATCGNGHDAAFLAPFVLPRGFLLAIDIQPEAILATTEQLKRTNIPQNRWACLQADHRNLASLLPPELSEGLDAAVFNLGYLPGGPKSITTSASSLEAIQSTLPLLKPTGVLLITSYPGFPDGLAEHESIEQWLTLKANEGRDLHHIRSVGRQNRPPELWILANRYAPPPAPPHDFSPR